jgi:hypothetical protein
MPLSGKTRLEFEKLCGDWAFEEGAGDLQGNWDYDFAEWLVLAQLYQVDVDAAVPVATLAELGDHLDEGLIKEPTDENAKGAAKIQDEICKRFKERKPVWDMLVLGWVYEFSRRNRRCPTAKEVADLMRLSRPALYRRSCNADKINDAYLIAIREFRRELPDPSGLDSVQKQNKEAKNRGSGRVDRRRLDRALFLKGS